MPNYRRPHVAGAGYFFTVALADRRSDLLFRNVGLLRDIVREVRQRHPFHIDAWVVMPDHMHAVWTLPEDDDGYGARWRLIKAGFSLHLPAGEERSASREQRGERGIWQRRFWEHLIRNEDDYARHVDYVHFNPVKHGRVGRVADWPCSSFHRWVAAGRLVPDWGGDSVRFASLIAPCGEPA